MMKFNVLDEVYHFGYGWGFVNEITYKGEEGHRIDVIFKDCDGDKVIKWFDIEGIEWHSCQSFPSIFLKKELTTDLIKKAHPNQSEQSIDKDLLPRPFTPILVRDSDDEKWGGAFFLCLDAYSAIYHVRTTTGLYGIGAIYNDETAHVLGTSADLPEKYIFYRDED